MDLEQIEAVLEEALGLQPPRFGPDESPGNKVRMIEDYLNAVACANANVVRARHWLRTARAYLADQWDRLEGWEVATNKPRARLTGADINRAKIAVAPAQYEAGRKARRLAESIDDQVVRFEREERVMSRLYSMIAGS